MANSHEGLCNLMDDIKEHDAGPMLGRRISELIGSLMRIADDEEREAPARANEEAQGSVLKHLQHGQRSSINALWDKHANTLNDLGLSIVAVNSGATIITGSGTLPNEQASLVIRNPEKLKSFLQAMDSDASQNPQLRKNISSLVGILETQLFKTNWNAPSEEALNFIQCLSPLATELRRVGLESESQRIEEVTRWLKAGVMRDYVDMRNQGIFAKPGKGFGPANWQIDMTNEQFTKRWTLAIESLQQLEEKPRAAVLARELRAHLCLCAESAMTYLNGLKTKDSPQAIAFKATLAIALTKLNKA